jgi:hypothetical protein
MFENRVVRRTLRCKREEVTEAGENWMTGNFMIDTAHHIILG